VLPDPAPDLLVAQAQSRRERLDRQVEQLPIRRPGQALGRWPTGPAGKHRGAPGRSPPDRQRLVGNLEEEHRPGRHDIGPERPVESHHQLDHLSHPEQPGSLADFRELRGDGELPHNRERNGDHGGVARHGIAAGSRVNLDPARTPVEADDLGVETGGLLHRGGVQRAQQRRGAVEGAEVCVIGRLLGFDLPQPARAQRSRVGCVEPADVAEQPGPIVVRRVRAALREGIGQAAVGPGQPADPLHQLRVPLGEIVLVLPAAGPTPPAPSLGRRHSRTRANEDVVQLAVGAEPFRTELDRHPGRDPHRAHPSADPVARLEHGHGAAAVQQGARGGQSGEAGPDDDHMHAVKIAGGATAPWRDQRKVPGLTL
jgi:hypothetical protein